MWFYNRAMSGQRLEVELPASFRSPCHEVCHWPIVIEVSTFMRVVGPLLITADI